LLVEAIPHAEQPWLESAGHMAHLEEPERFAASVELFVMRAEPFRAGLEASQVRD
jgi:hypothetical protein